LGDGKGGNGDWIIIEEEIMLHDDDLYNNDWGFDVEDWNNEEGDIRDCDRDDRDDEQAEGRDNDINKLDDVFLVEGGMHSLVHKPTKYNRYKMKRDPPFDEDDNRKNSENDVKISSTKYFDSFGADGSYNKSPLESLFKSGEFGGVDSVTSGEVGIKIEETLEFENEPNDVVNHRCSEGNFEDGPEEDSNGSSVHSSLEQSIITFLSFFVSYLLIIISFHFLRERK